MLVALWAGRMGKILSDEVSLVGHPLQVLHGQNLLVECGNVRARNIVSGRVSLVGQPLQVSVANLLVALWEGADGENFIRQS